MAGPWRLSAERQDEILALLAARPMLGKEIAEEIGLTQPSVSNGLEALQRAGLVARGYSLTDEGRRRAKGGSK